MVTHDPRSVEASVATRHPGTEGPPNRRRSGWIIAASVVLVLGLLVSVTASLAVANSQAERARRVFAASSSQIASTLQLAIQHEEDLIVSANGFVAGDPLTTNAEFLAWAASVHAVDRYPELSAIGYVVIVPASQLARFAAQATAHPLAALSPDAPAFQVYPPGNRPYYCLAVAGLATAATVQTPPGLDLCAADVGHDLLTGRDSGEGTYRPFTVGDVVTLSVETPVYRGGLVPKTIQARRAAFLGWVGMAFDPDVVLTRALSGQPGMAVALRYHDAFSNAAFQGGTPPPGATTLTVDLHNGWTVTTFGAAARGGVLTNGDALTLLLAGIALSGMLAALVFVLGTGRARAIRLVRERTGELRHQALHDALTRLPNRALIMDRIEQLLARGRRRGSIGAVLFVDLDEFKNVNDTLGHAAGDRLLVAVAARLKSTLREADTIGRMGGDEFVVLIGDTSIDSVELVASRLLSAMRQPFELDGATTRLVVTASIGIAMGDRADPGDLLRDADVALYEAKAAGKDRYEIFHQEMQVEISRRIGLEFDLRSALEGEQFRLVYQPIYDLDDLSLTGVEALLRWDHPTLGLVSPEEFIPILEQTGQIREVGRWVLHRACVQMAAWQARGDTLDMSVNVSGRQLDSDAIVDHIREALQFSGLDATSLILEVTETALMRNADATAERLDRIKDLGVRIAVDDFGTGYSSLACLRQFPVDCLKIDRSFTSAITTSRESKALMRTLVQLGKDLGLKTLAEGVETTDELDLLRAEHVDQAQGFLLARPLDPDILESRLLAPARPIAIDVPLPT